MTSDTPTIKLKLSNDITLTQETIRIQNYKRRTTRTARLSTILHQINEGKIEHTLKDCLTSLMKDTSLRSPAEIIPIKNFLLKSELATKFRMDNILEEYLEELLTLISTEMNYYFLEKDNTVFHIGDVGDNFYLIINGKVSVLIPILVKERMTGFQYFTHIMTLHTNNENYLLNQTLEYNTKLLNVRREDLNDLSLMVFKICLEDYFARTKHQGLTLHEISKMCFVPNFYFDDIITNEIEGTTEPFRLKKEEAELFERLNKYDEQMLKRYRILVNDIVKFDVNLFKYKTKLQLTNGNYFGDVALDQYTTRNATIRTEEDTDFCYIDFTHYNNCLRYEKQKLNLKEISFLVDNYFFKSMQYKDFEKKIFICFECQEKYKNEYICVENEPTNHLFFISEGQIELTFYKSLSDIHKTISDLKQLLKKKDINNRELNDIPKVFYSSGVPVAKKMTNKIFVLSNIELIGLESLFFGLNYLCSAKIISEKAKIYKIDIEYVLKLINDKSLSKDLMTHYKESAEQKMQIFINRIHDLYDSKIDMYNKKQKLSLCQLLIIEDKPKKKKKEIHSYRYKKYHSNDKDRTYEYCSGLRLIKQNNNTFKNKCSHLHKNFINKMSQMIPSLTHQGSKSQLLYHNTKTSRAQEFSQNSLHLKRKEQQINNYLSSRISFKHSNTISDNYLGNSTELKTIQNKRKVKDKSKNKNSFNETTNIKLSKIINTNYFIKDPVEYKVDKIKIKKENQMQYPLISNINLTPREHPSTSILSYQKYKYSKKPKLKLGMRLTFFRSSFHSSNIEKNISTTCHTFTFNKTNSDS